MEFIRARSGEQKQQRINLILNSAEELLQSERYENISILNIAKHANFTRSNIYKYFQTKEEIYLSILKRDILTCLSELIETIPSTSLEMLPASWANTVVKYPMMLFLQSILYTILEHNASVEHLAEYKLAMLNKSYALIEILTTTHPQKSPEEWLNFLQIQAALMIGLYPMSQQTEKQKEALEKYSLNYSAVNFFEMYRDSLTKFL